MLNQEEEESFQVCLLVVAFAVWRCGELLSFSWSLEKNWAVRCRFLLQAFPPDLQTTCCSSPESSPSRMSELLLPPSLLPALLVALGPLLFVSEFSRVLARISSYNQSLSLSLLPLCKTPNLSISLSLRTRSRAICETHHPQNKRKLERLNQTVVHRRQKMYTNPPLLKKEERIADLDGWTTPYPLLVLLFSLKLET